MEITDLAYNLIYCLPGVRDLTIEVHEDEVVIRFKLRIKRIPKFYQKGYHWLQDLAADLGGEIETDLGL